MTVAEALDATPQVKAEGSAAVPPSEGEGGGGDKTAAPAPADAKAAQAAPAVKPEPKPDAKPPLAAGGADDKPDPKGGEKKTLAAGADTEAEDKAKQADKPYWPDNWREKLAEHIAAGDKKLYAKELKRLERIADPSGVYGMYREMESKFTGGGIIKVPGKDAKPEEIAEYQKALGWKDKPEDMLAEIKLENGAVLGDADKPVLNTFLAAVHGATSAQDFISKATNWYFGNQEKAAAAMDEADDDFRRTAERELKDELGPTYKRRMNAVSSLFALAPGGANLDNPGSLLARVLGGRTADGKIIGNDPDFNRFFMALANEINPAATVVEDGDPSGLSVDAEIKTIEARMRNDRAAYYKDEPAQARYRELITTREKIRARAR